MEPILFPYTYLSEPRYHLLRALFRPLTILQAGDNQIPDNLKSWAAEGGLAIRIPVKERGAELARCLADYAAWAVQQQGMGRQGRVGLDSQFFRHHDPQVPFFEDSAVTRLKSAIRGGSGSAGGDSAKVVASEEDRLFQARLFLTMAQEFDRQQWDLVRDLRAHDDQERLLMDDLHGSPSSMPPSSPVSPPAATDSPDAYQVGTRLRAWIRLWGAEIDAGKSPALLITPHGQVVAELEGVVPQLEKFSVLDSLPHGMGDHENLRKGLMDWLTQLANRDGDPLAELPLPSELRAGEDTLPIPLEVFIAPHHPWSILSLTKDQPQMQLGQNNPAQPAHGRHGVLILVADGGHRG